MNSHVVKTGDIKELVITEEAGIAKGIRRIIAITGDDAREASQRANETEAEFQSIKKLSLKEKEKALKLYEPVSYFLQTPLTLCSFLTSFLLFRN